VLAYLAVFAAAAATSALATPLVRAIATRVGAIDRPSDRKVHPKPTPTLGGLAIFLGFLVAMGVAYLIPAFRDNVFRVSSEPLGALLAGGVIVAVGTFDDVRSVSVPAKVAGQVLAAGVMILAGIQLVFFWFPTQGVLSLGPDLGVPLTVIWILVMVNAVNLIDGLDGLAAGVVAIAAIAFFSFAFGSERALGGPTTASMLSAIAAGAAIGFLPWNFHPAKIFMGDSGSMLLGVIMAAATISGVGRTVQAPPETDLAALAIPIIVPAMVLAVPIIDVAFAVLRRMRRGRAVTHADKEHIHHRLLEIGHTHREAVLLIYFWSAILAGAAIAITFVTSRATAVALLAAALAVFLATLIPRLRTGNGIGYRHRTGRTTPPGAASPATPPPVPPPAPEGLPRS